LPPLVSGGQRHTLRRLMRAPAYLLLVLAIGLAGATEVTVAQWTSAFVQRGLGFAKVVADLVGFSLFGVGMIVGRLWFGFKGESDALPRNMAWGAALSAVMCLVMALSPWPVLSLAACGLAGLFVSLLWPGTVSLAAARFPLAGASMFAMLAAAGDTGAGFMPWGVGAIADWAPAHVAWLGAVLGRGLPPDQLGLRAGLLATAVCPVMMALLVAVYARLRADRRNENAG